MLAEQVDIDSEVAFRDFTLRVRQAIPLEGVTGVFGQSGSGKSTLLRTIAGLEKTARGCVHVSNMCWQDSGRRVFVPPHKRDVGFMFQRPQLFPHLSVAANLSFADTRNRQKSRNLQMDAVVEALELAHLLERRPDQLSGGEQQRVALARTLLRRPKLLLLDEPLSALDSRRKADLLPYLRDVPARFGVPSIYVSHDVDEVAVLCDRVLHLETGKVKQFGPAADVLNRLGLEPGAAPYEAAAILEGAVLSWDDDLKLTTIRVDDCEVTLPFETGRVRGQSVRLRIRARDVAIATVRPEGISIRNVLPVTIDAIRESPDPAFLDVRLRLSKQVLDARITKLSVRELGLESGQSVFGLVKSTSLSV